MLYERDEGRAREESLLGVEDARSATPTVAARQLSNTGMCLAHIQREIGRARAALNEAQHLALDLGLEFGNMEIGLGIVALWDGESDAATKHLTRALDILRREPDRYLECKCLMYLARLELELEKPEQALNHCKELMPVALGMGEGSEAPLALALEALANVALGSSDAAARLAEALDALDEIDAQAALAYALNAAALFDLRAGRLQSATERAKHAVRAAERVGRKTEVAFARALLAEVALAEGHHRAARAQIESILPESRDGDAFDARTRKALRAVARQLEIEFPAVDLTAI
jgi:tetratricopeptide (TPR) repeat protein